MRKPRLWKRNKTDETYYPDTDTKLSTMENRTVLPIKFRKRHKRPITVNEKIKMSDEQQRKPKRYRFEVELDKALLEDALNGTLGQAATKLLKRITFMNKKENPLHPNGDNGDPAEPANTENEQSKEPKDKNKNEKVNHIIKRYTTHVTKTEGSSPRKHR